MYQWVGKLPGLPGGGAPEAKAVMQICSSLGAAAGCVLAAVLGGKFGRRPVYAGLCILSAISMVGFYRLNTEYGAVFLISATAALSRDGIMPAHPARTSDSASAKRSELTIETSERRGDWKRGCRQCATLSAG